MKLLFAILFLFNLSATDSEEISQIRKAERDFDKRYKKIENGKANPNYTNRAIKHYLKAADTPEKMIGLLRSYEFKGSWTNVDEATAKRAYEKGIKVGKEAMAKYPNNAGIMYWYIANYSRWGDIISITEAASEGVLDEVKSICEKIISLDPSFNEGGALRLLGGIHLEAPYIPFVLTWPSDEKAQELLSRAYQIAPEHTANAYYYAKMLLNEGEGASAKSVLKKLIDSEPRSNYLLTDRKFINKGEELYREEF